MAINIVATFLSDSSTAASAEDLNEMKTWDLSK